MQLPPLSPANPPLPAPDRRGWHRTVGWPALIAVSVFITVAWLALLAAGLWHLRLHGLAEVAVPDQPLRLRLPPGLAAQAHIHTPIATRLASSQPLQLPLDQTVSAQVLDRLQGRVRVAAAVPVSTAVEVDTQVVVETTLTMEVPVVRWLPALTVTVPLAVTVPIRTAVPVAFTMPLTLDVAVDARMDEVLAVPLRTVLHSRIALDQPMTVDVLNRTRFTLQGPMAPFEVRVQDSVLRIPFRDLGWARAGAPAGRDDEARP